MTETEYRDKQLNAYYKSQECNKSDKEIADWIEATLAQWAVDGELRVNGEGEIIIPDKIEDDDGFIYTIAHCIPSLRYAKLWKNLQEIYDANA